MSFRRKPAQSNDVINFKDGYLASEQHEPISALKDEISQLRSKLEEREETNIRSTAMDKISALERKMGDLNMMDARHCDSRTHSKLHHNLKSHSHESSNCPKPASKFSHRAEVLERLDSLERSMSNSKVSDQLSRLELKLGSPSRDVMDKLTSLESRIASTSNPVLERLDHIEGRMSTPDKVMSKLNALESRLNSPSDQVMSKLTALESRLNSPSDQVMSKLTALESRLNTPSDQVMSKLSALETKLSHPDHEFTHALSRLNAMHDEMSSSGLREVKESVNSKLLELEKRIGTTPAVTADDWLQERKRLSKLQAMRSKIANA
jgi:hypothetical protein